MDTKRAAAARLRAATELRCRAALANLADPDATFQAAYKAAVAAAGNLNAYKSALETLVVDADDAAHAADWAAIAARWDAKKARNAADAHDAAADAWDGTRRAAIQANSGAKDASEAHDHSDHEAFEEMVVYARADFSKAADALNAALAAEAHAAEALNAYAAYADRKAAHAADGKRTASIDDSDDRGYAAGFDAGFEAGYKAARADDYIAPHADGKWER